jgi:pimeloyl-ACP methyl ester carboxylesterase
MGVTSGGRSVGGVLVGVTLVLMIVAVAALGWRLVTGDSTYDPQTPLADQCGDIPHDATRVTIKRDDEMTLGGALVGPSDAEVGVVLRQGAGQTICDWLPLADIVARHTGARVLLFDRRGRGSSPGEGDLTAEPGDLVAAVDLLRQQGADRVALVGSSMGNSVTFAALDELSPQPCALVSISPVLVASDSHGTVDGRADVPYPREVWITWEEQNPSIAANVELIRARARHQHIPPPHLHGVDTYDHSIQLVDNHQDVRAFILQAVHSCTD